MTTDEEDVFLAAARKELMRFTIIGRDTADPERNQLLQQIWKDRDRLRKILERHQMYRPMRWSYGKNRPDEDLDPWVKLDDGPFAESAAKTLARQIELLQSVMRDKKADAALAKEQQAKQREKDEAERKATAEAQAAQARADAAAEVVLRPFKPTLQALEKLPAELQSIRERLDQLERQPQQGAAHAAIGAHHAPPPAQAWKALIAPGFILAVLLAAMGALFAHLDSMMDRKLREVGLLVPREGKQPDAAEPKQVNTNQQPSHAPTPVLVPPAGSAP